MANPVSTVSFCGGDFDHIDYRQNFWTWPDALEYADRINADIVTMDIVTGKKHDCVQYMKLDGKWVQTI